MLPYLLLVTWKTEAPTFPGQEQLRQWTVVHSHRAGPATEDLLCEDTTVNTFPPQSNASSSLQAAPEEKTPACRVPSPGSRIPGRLVQEEAPGWLGSRQRVGLGACALGKGAVGCGVERVSVLVTEGCEQGVHVRRKWCKWQR